MMQPQHDGGIEAVTVSFKCVTCGRHTVRKVRLGAQTPKHCALHTELREKAIGVRVYIEKGAP